MSKAVYISIINLYIINIVRQIRRELGLSQREVSRIISPDTVGNLVGTLETETGKSSYTDAQLHLLAKAFTRISTELQKEYDQFSVESPRIKTNYSIYDFYPKNKLEDGLVVKKIETFEKDLFPTGALYTILEETDFFLNARSLKETTTFINQYFKRTWKVTDFGSPLDRAARKGDLIKTDPPELVTYRKASK